MATTSQSKQQHAIILHQGAASKFAPVWRAPSELHANIILDTKKDSNEFEFIKDKVPKLEHIRSRHRIFW